MTSILLRVLLTANLLTGFPSGQGVYQHIRNTVSFSNSRPEFELPGSTNNVSSVIGQTTHLHCTVRNLGDKTVSWIRKVDLHVLTSGTITFTGDRRFSALHQDQTDTWSLQIRSTQQRDAGEYHCQVNTEPKISQSFFLSVAEAKAEIQGKNQEVIVKKGSSLELKCLVNRGEGVHQESMAVFWYLNGTVLDWMGQTGPGQGVKVEERDAGHNTRIFESVLRVSKARTEHEGIYTCGPTLGREDNVRVHVSKEGEQPEAWSGNSSFSLYVPSSSLFIAIIIMLLVL